MLTDVVLMDKNKEVESLGKKLGFARLLFNEDIKKLRIAKGGEYNENRKALENKNTDILLNPESTKKSSDINHILCKLAKKNNIILLFSLGILNGNILRKLMSDIKLFRKYNVKCAVSTFARDKYELKNAQDIISLCKILGMTPKEAKNSLIHIYNKYREKTDKSIITKGIKIKPKSL